MSKKFLPAFVVGVSVFYLIDLCLLAATAHWPPEWWWLANLFEIAPLWVLFFPLAALFFLGILIGSRFVNLVNTISAFIIFFGIMQFQMSIPSQVSNVDSVRTFKMISVNMGNVSDLQRTIALIARENPHLVAFQELDPEQESELKVNLKANEWDIQSYQNLALASRFPIINVQSRNREALGGWGGLVARFQVKTPIGAVYVFNMHLATPRTGVEAIIYERFAGLREMKRVTQLQEIESAAAFRYTLASQPALIAGDFNLRESNPIFKAYWSKFSDAFSKKGTGFGYTKHTRWHGVRIDHILSDGNWRTVDARVGPSLGGDHLPLIAQMIFMGVPAKAPDLPQIEEQTQNPAADQGVFIFENFESSPGRFAFHSNAGLSVYEAPDNSPSRALKIKSGLALDESVAGIQTESWNIESFSMLRFSYFIPSGTPVRMRVQTQLGDWIPLSVSLVDDGMWHTAEINVKASVQNVLRGIKSLKAFEFYIPLRQSGEYFWIDDFKIAN